MIKNFSIRDAVTFDFPTEINLRNNCELLSVTINVVSQPSVEMNWKIINTNRSLRIIFTGLEDFEVRGRDPEYPCKSARVLGIAGFCSKSTYTYDNDFYVDSDNEMNYLAFVMDDRSAYLIKSEKGQMEIV